MRCLWVQTRRVWVICGVIGGRAARLGYRLLTTLTEAQEMMEDVTARLKAL